jgi:uncharacterized membrane protein YkvA (DUF1232 family)
MTSQSNPDGPDEALGFLKDLVRQIRLLWRLLNDPRVPVWVKTIPLVALLYLIFPIDLVPDPALGLGQLDDLAVMLLGLKFFRDMSPRAVVNEHESDIDGKRVEGGEDEPPTIDAEYRVIDEES